MERDWVSSSGGAGGGWMLDECRSLSTNRWYLPRGVHKNKKKLYIIICLHTNLKENRLAKEEDNGLGT